jgi:hypothetical protein
LCVVSRAGLYVDVVDIAGIPGLASAIITGRPARPRARGETVAWWLALRMFRGVLLQSTRR